MSASPPHASLDATDNRHELPERNDDHDGRDKSRRPSRALSPTPREDFADFKKPSRRSYSRSRSPARDRGGENKSGRYGRDMSLSPVRDRDRNRYYESESPSPRNSYRRGSRYRSRSFSRDSRGRGRSRSRSPVRHRHHRSDRGDSRRYRRRDRKRHRYDSRSRSRSRSPMRNGGGEFDDESRSSRSPPRRRARYDSRSPEYGRYGRRDDFDRGSRRNRDRDRRGRGPPRGPFYDDQATQSLFVSALNSTAQRHTPPFNVSIINDRMRQLDRSWNVGNSDFKRFADLCHEMHRRGILEVNRVRETICVTRFVDRPLNGRLDEPRRREDDRRFDRNSRGPPRDEYRWRRDEKGNYSRQLITEEDRRHSRDRRNKFGTEDEEIRERNRKDVDSVDKNGLAEGEEKMSPAQDEKENSKDGVSNGEKEVGSTDREGVSDNPDAVPEKDGSIGGDVAENGKKSENMVAKTDVSNEMDTKVDAGNTNSENCDKEPIETNGVSKKESVLEPDEKDRDSVMT